MAVPKACKVEYANPPDGRPGTQSKCKYLIIEIGGFKILVGGKEQITIIIISELINFENYNTLLILY